MSEFKFMLHNIADGIGQDVMARRMGINYSTFKSKLNPNLDTHHLYAEELPAFATAANTDSIAQYFAEQRGLMCIKKPDFDALSDKEILDLFLDLQAQQGAWANEIRKAMLNGEIDWNELVSIRSEYNKFIAAAAEVMNRLQSFMAVTEETNAKRNKK